MASEARVELIPHPDAAGPLRAVTVVVQRDAGRLHLRYRLEGEVTRVRVPPPAEPAFTIGLWEHTCVEAFIAAEGAVAYHELNLSPSGEWAAFAFTDYRALGTLDGDVPAPRIEARVTDGALELDALVAFDALAPSYGGAPLRLGLSAVIETVDGELSYWSLLHPRGSADFHHHSTRALSLPGSRADR
jgi:hypothetical protein